MLFSQPTQSVPFPKINIFLILESKSLKKVKWTFYQVLLKNCFININHHQENYNKQNGSNFEEIFPLVSQTPLLKEIFTPKNLYKFILPANINGQLVYFSIIFLSSPFISAIVFIILFIDCSDAPSDVEIPAIAKHITTTEKFYSSSVFSML